MRIVGSSMRSWVSPDRTDSQLAAKPPAYPDMVMLALLKTRLSKKQNVQHMFVSSLLEANAANPPPEDIGSETGAAQKKRAGPGGTSSTRF